MTSERSWVRGDRDTSCCLCKSGARSRSRVFPLPRILSKLPPEPPGPPPLTLRTLGPSPLPQRASGEALPRLTRSAARGACTGRGLALALVLISLRASPAILVDISALSTAVRRLNRQTNAVNSAQTGLFRLKRSPPLRRSVTQLVNTRAKAALPAIHEPMSYLHK